MRRRSVLLLVAGGLLLLGSSLSLEPAVASGASSIDDSGWWWKLQTNPDVLLPPPPTVSDGQLMVQGAPDGASALAAVAATLASGEANPVLTLKVASGGDTGGDGAVLLACPAGAQWKGGSARAWSEHPPPACKAGGVVGKRSADGTAWTFDLTALQFTDQVNVVLTPGVVDAQPAGANGSVFSLVFEKPTAASIQTSPGEPPAPPTTAPAPSGDGAGVVSFPSTGGGDVSFDSPSLDTGSFDLPPVVAAVPDSEQSLTPVAPSVQRQNELLPASVSVDPRSPHARGVGVLLLVLGGLVVYAATKQQPAVGPEGIPGGLARWSKPRWGAPPSLRG